MRVKCPDCKGWGKKHKTITDIERAGSLYDIKTVFEQCPTCKGEGEVEKEGK